MVNGPLRELYHPGYMDDKYGFGNFAPDDTFPRSF